MTQDHSTPEAADDSSAASAVLRSAGRAPTAAARCTGSGPEWRRGDDGLLFREAARVILLDEDDRVLLIRGHDVDQPDRSWWFTVGGGIDDGEDAMAAAVREVREETGIVLVAARPRRARCSPGRRSSTSSPSTAGRTRSSTWRACPRPRSAPVDRGGWTELEHDVIDELRWWSLDDLDRVDIEVFPDRLVDLVRGLLPAWDGETRHLGLRARVGQVTAVAPSPRPGRGARRRPARRAAPARP